MLKYLKNKYVIVTSVVLLWILFFDSNNIISWLRDRSLVRNQEEQKEYYKKEIKRLDEKLQELKSNKDSLEKFAREEYLFHKPDEDVYIYPTE